MTVDEAIQQLTAIRERFGGDSKCQVEVDGSVPDENGGDYLMSIRGDLLRIDRQCGGEIIFCGEE